MRFLFIHQNFPGQFRHLSVALAREGHEAVALTPRVKQRTNWNGVDVRPYRISRSTGRDTHPWLTDMDTKVIRGEACYRAAMALRNEGFHPDAVIAHPGWGESLFLKDVWPNAPLGLYCELYHLSDPAHTGFDPEFPGPAGDAEPLRIRMKNLNNRMHFELGDLGISPTAFQAHTFPERFRGRISVIHDGIDTHRVQPGPTAQLTLPNGRVLSRDDEVVSFVNRNLEPMRGYHSFMRALGPLLQARPEAQVLIVGGDGVSYGAAAPEGTTWKQIYIDEVRGSIPEADWARVHFLGRIPYDDFVSLLQITRLHVYLTAPFVLSWSLLEAMAAGAPILASDTAPVTEVLRDGENAWLTDFFDSEALAAKAAALLADAGARAALGAQARADVVARYDLTTVCLPQQMRWVQELTHCMPQPALD